MYGCLKTDVVAVALDKISTGTTRGMQGFVLLMASEVSAHCGEEEMREQSASHPSSQEIEVSLFWQLPLASLFVSPGPPAMA